MVTKNVILLSKKVKGATQIGAFTEDVCYKAPYIGKPHLEKMRLALRSRFEKGRRNVSPGTTFVFNVAFDEKRKEVSWIISTCK